MAFSWWDFLDGGWCSLTRAQGPAIDSSNAMGNSGSGGGGGGYGGGGGNGGGGGDGDEDPRDPDEWWHNRDPRESWADDSWQPTPAEDFDSAPVTLGNLAPLFIKEVWLAIAAIFIAVALNLGPTQSNLGLKVGGAVFVIGSLALTFSHLKRWR